MARARNKVYFNQKKVTIFVAKQYKVTNTNVLSLPLCNTVTQLSAYCPCALPIKWQQEDTAVRDMPKTNMPEEAWPKHSNPAHAMAAEAESWYLATTLQLINLTKPWEFNSLPKHPHHCVSSVMPQHHVSSSPKDSRASMLKEEARPAAPESTYTCKC